MNNICKYSRLSFCCENNHPFTRKCACSSEQNQICIRTSKRKNKTNRRKKKSWTNIFSRKSSTVNRKREHFCCCCCCCSKLEIVTFLFRFPSDNAMCTREKKKTNEITTTKKSNSWKRRNMFGIIYCIIISSNGRESPFHCWSSNWIYDDNNLHYSSNLIPKNLTHPIKSLL